jgi:hypothetical protein
MFRRLKCLLGLHKTVEYVSWSGGGYRIRKRVECLYCKKVVRKHSYRRGSYEFDKAFYALCGD